MNRNASHDGTLPRYIAAHNKADARPLNAESIAPLKEKWEWIEVFRPEGFAPWTADDPILLGASPLALRACRRSSPSE
jgi:hypothetical protein